MRSLLVLFLYLHTVWSCMPGYGHERMKLKEYLGIEWIENGLNKTAENDDKPIRHASDLDCRFDEPADCRWRNVKASEYLDTLDFYLFEKTDFTEFPVLQVRPGPSKLNEGDKLIFTGDRKREEQTAIWRSSPIACQNTTGQLTFTFWLYNGARVEVVLLEKKAGRLRILPEKPFVDCGTVPVNTDCTADIPPRETPFSIGIRAYDISNREGSFVMIDNIVYRATLCKLSIDLGESFGGRPLITNTVMKEIESSEQLSCSKFDSNCRWRSVGHSKEAWQIADQSPPNEKMFNATGTFMVPDAPFLYMYIEQDRNAPFNVLRSDPIACQTEEESEFSFRFWATRDAVIEICITDLKENELECHIAPMANSPDPARFSFGKHESFTITIKVKSVNSDYDNFIAIDDISYQAVMCSEATDAWDLGADFYSVPMLSALLHRPIFSAKDLDCPFDHRAVDCLWASEEADSPSWLIGSAPINKHKFHSLTGIDLMPEGEFAFVRLNEGETSNLMTEAIRCVTTEATLTFRFWQTGSAHLSVCLLEEKLPEVIDCQKITLPQPGPAVIDVPDMSHSFRIAFRAEATSKGIVMIDDITVQGDICPSSLRQHGVRTAALKTIESPDSNVCRLLTCRFLGGQMCLYTSGRVASSQSRFQAGNASVSASLFSKGKVAVLESPPFELNTAARVHFAYQKEVGGSSLFVCQDSVSQELDKCFEVGSNTTSTTWTKDFMEILPSDTKFYVFAKLREGSRKARVSITNLTLTDLDNNPACVL